MKFSIFAFEKNLYILHGHVFVMYTVYGATSFQGCQHSTGTMVTEIALQLSYIIHTPDYELKTLEACVLSPDGPVCGLIQLWYSTRVCIIVSQMSCIMRKADFCLCKNKGADQLCSNCTADQCLCFRYSDSTIPLLLIHTGKRKRTG